MPAIDANLSIRLHLAIYEVTTRYGASPDYNPPAVATMRRPLSGFYVLIVDDHREARDTLRLLLAYSGAVVTVASSAQAAVDALQRVRADVVLADIVLGGPEDGLWLLRQARARWPRLPFIAISGEDVDTDALASAGFAAYLRKPVPHDTLVNAVLAAIAQPSGNSG